MAFTDDFLLPPGLLAGRPAFGVPGRIYYATDANTLTYDTGLAWVNYTGVGPHDILSAAHGDSDPQAVTRGSLIYGDATPEWTELVIGAAGRVLTVNPGGTEPEWIAAGGGVWELIAETALGAPAASVTFAAIAGTYRHIKIFARIRSSRAAAGDEVMWQLNGDGGANYDYVRCVMRSAGFSTNTSRGATSVMAAGCEDSIARANCFSPMEVIWNYYAETDSEKYGLAQSGIIKNLSADGDVIYLASMGHWRSTSAITSVTLFPLNGPNFLALSTFSLYGIN